MNNKNKHRMKKN